MSTCGAPTGILFTRRVCGKPAATRCHTCNALLCPEHVVPQRSGAYFLCPECARYENDSDHNWEHTDDGWHWRGESSSADSTDPAEMGEGGGEAAGAGASGSWDTADAGEFSRDTSAGAADDSGTDHSGTDDSDSSFDAS